MRADASSSASRSPLLRPSLLFCVPLSSSSVETLLGASLARSLGTDRGRAGYAPTISKHRTREDSPERRAEARLHGQKEQATHARAERSDARTCSGHGPCQASTDRLPPGRRDRAETSRENSARSAYPIHPSPCQASTDRRPPGRRDRAEANREVRRHSAAPPRTPSRNTPDTFVGLSRRVGRQVTMRTGHHRYRRRRPCHGGAG